MDRNWRIRYVPAGGGKPVEITPLEPRPSQFAEVEPFGFGSEGWYRPPPSLQTQAIQCNAVSFTQSWGSGAGAGTRQVWFALQGVTPANEQVAVLVFDADTKLGVAYYTFPTGVHVIEHVERGASGGDVVIYAAPNTGAQANACWVCG